MGPVLPPEPASAERITADWGQRVIRYLRAITCNSSATVQVNTTHNGTTLAAAPQGSGTRAAAALRLPFEFYSTTDEEGDRMIAMQPGRYYLSEPNVAEAEVEFTEEAWPTATRYFYWQRDNEGEVTVQGAAAAPTKVYDYDAGEDTLVIRILLAKYDFVTKILTQYWRGLLPVPYGGVWS